ncbi:hemolysin secretion protein D [Afipia sp. P52-10]|uniref:efflux RND transporter periplasmic adaptor subunit n=1 Tax=Afipia sp. P52-10 TaxID=1429916 RepID=UPI0003DEF4D8|nr:hemolysin secretion protein D [Afipia sp. P52-10]
MMMHAHSFQAGTPALRSLGFVLAALSLAACDGTKQQTAQSPPVVTVAAPTQRVVTDWDEFVGRFEATQQVQVRARVGGFVKSIDFKDGAMVKTGDLLYVIDPRPYEAVQLQARGQLADAKARQTLAERELARATELSKTQAVSESVVDQRRQQLQAAQAAVLQAEGVLERASLDVEFTRVTAPIDGRISRHLVALGNLVQGGDSGSTVLTSIVSMDPIHIYFDMDEATYLKNNRLWFEGKRPSSRDTPNPVQITLSGESKPSREGKMDFLDNRLDIATGTLRGRAIVPNTDLSILPGQFARVRVLGSAPYQALLLPDTAITNDQSRKVVFVVNKDDVVEMRPVVLGPLDDGLRVVREGINADDRVIVDGLQRARIGAKVTPQTTKAPPPPAAPAAESAKESVKEPVVQPAKGDRS